MRRLAIFSVSAALFALPASAQVSIDPANAPPGAYRLDSAHTQVLFSIVHGGLTDYYGRFDRLSGTLSFNPAQLEKSEVAVVIDTASVDTPSTALNNELRGPDVFDSQKFAAATFKSTAVHRTGPSSGTISGDLTLHGVTKPITLDVTFRGGEPNPLGNSYSLGFAAGTTIRRTDFGITGMRWEPFVGDDVRLTIVAMFDREK